MLIKYLKALFWPFVDDGLVAEMKYADTSKEFCVLTLSGVWGLTSKFIPLVPTFGPLGWEKRQLSKNPNLGQLVISFSNLEIMDKMGFYSDLVATMTQLALIAKEQGADWWGIHIDNPDQSREFCDAIKLVRFGRIFQGHVYYLHAN